MAFPANILAMLGCQGQQIAKLSAFVMKDCIFLNVAAGQSKI